MKSRLPRKESSVPCGVEPESCAGGNPAMLTKSHKSSPVPSLRNVGKTGLAVFLGLFLSTAIFAQQDQSRPSMREQDSLRRQAGLPELAIQNLDRVAASAAQIEEVLQKDPGLMVELKRWVAKEATDNGQVVEDSDVTDQAIFGRLGSDVAFRAVATRLLQRYGFLMPAVLPGSEYAKEQELRRPVARTEASENSDAIPPSIPDLPTERTPRTLRAGAVSQGESGLRRRPSMQQGSELTPSSLKSPLGDPPEAAPIPGRDAALTPGNPSDASEWASASAAFQPTGEMKPRTRAKTDTREGQFEEESM